MTLLLNLNIIFLLLFFFPFMQIKKLFSLSIPWTLVRGIFYYPSSLFSLCLMQTELLALII